MGHADADSRARRTLDGVLRTLPTWPVAAGSFVAGFAVAQATGVRPLGGLVLLAGVLWCLPRWHRGVGVVGAAGLTVAYAAAFAASHVLATAIGAWPSVLLLASAIGAGCRVLVDGRESAGLRE